MTFKQKILKQFDDKFVSPKTLWAQDKNGKWYGKEDVKEFLSKAIDEAYIEGLKEGLKSGKDLPKPLTKMKCKKCGKPYEFKPYGKGTSGGTYTPTCKCRGNVHISSG